MNDLNSLNSQTLDALVFHLKAMQPVRYGSKSGHNGWEALASELSAQGLGKATADALISWANLESTENQKQPIRLRVLHPMEREFISMDAYTYMLELYAMGLLSMIQLEGVIENCAFYPNLPVTVPDLKKMLLHLFSENLRSQGLESSH